jgi:hypothetical protein
MFKHDNINSLSGLEADPAYRKVLEKGNQILLEDITVIIELGESQLRKSTLVNLISKFFAKSSKLDLVPKSDEEKKTFFGTLFFLFELLSHYIWVPVY